MRKIMLTFFALFLMFRPWCQGNGKAITTKTENDLVPEGIALDKKGNIYVAFGAPNNNCQEKNRVPGSPGINPCPWLDDHGGVWKFDANKLNQRQEDGVRYATGLRSIVGMDWNHADDALYVVHHGRDDLYRL